MAFQSPTLRVFANQPLRVDSEFYSQSKSDVEYRIRPKDLLGIHIEGCICSCFGERYEVDDRGMVQVPFVDNDIQAAGKTTNELAAEITVRLKRYLKNPETKVRMIGQRT